MSNTTLVPSLLAMAASAAMPVQPAATEASRSNSTAAPAARADHAGHAHATGTNATTQSRNVVRDRATGRLRAPTTEELQAQRDARMARGEPEGGTSTPTVVRQHANGMRSAMLGDEHMSTLMAVRGPDGKLIVKHAKPSDDHAHGAPRSAAPRSKPELATE